MRTACTAGTFAAVATLLAVEPQPLQARQDNKPLVIGKPVPPAAAATGDALVVYSAGIDAILSDPKDAGLARALKMLDERVLELPRETGDHNIPAPAIQLALQLLMSPMSLRAAMVDNPNPNAPPFAAQLSFYGSPDVAGDFAGRFAGMIAEMGAPPAQPAPGVAGMQMIDADGVPMYFGTTKAGDGSAFVVGLNKVGSAEVVPDASGLPKDVKPTMSFMLDAAKLQPLFDMGFAHAGDDPQAQMARKQLEMVGLYGPNATQIVAAIGHGKDRSHGWVKYVNYRKMLESLGMTPTSMLSAADLKRIPADATFAQVGKVNLAGMLEMLKNMAAQEMHHVDGGEEQDPFEFIEGATGIHPQRDLVAHMGETMGAYMADSTGGGGLTSMVVFMEVKNADSLSQTLARIRGQLNQIAQQEANGYVRIGERDLAGQKVMTLMFPGLPIPLEVCWTIADGWLYAAGTPNALQAAIAHAKSGKSSLADNANFKAMGGGELKDAMQVQFIDTPRLLGQGYGMVSMGMSALANVTRSPTDLQRDAGLIMPPYTELARDAKAAVTISRIVGDDLIMTSQADRSMLVNTCGALGSIGGAGGVAVIAAMSAGVMLPALGQARSAAQEVQGMTQLRQISVAYVMYAADNADAMPTSADDLFKAEYLTPDIMDSPAGDAPGGADIWLNTKGGKSSAIAHPDRYIIAYDRAMYANGDSVAVAFLDGHVEEMSVMDFLDATEDDLHNGIEFNLP